jgi:hypothetical protein
MHAPLPIMQTPSMPSTAAFVSIVLAICLALLFGVTYAATSAELVAQRRSWLFKTAFGLLAWLAITGALSASGVLAIAVLPPPLLVFVVMSLVVPTVFACSALGTRLVRGLPIAALIGFQSFRLPLELVLHSWYRQGVIPVQMTYLGHNFDIVSGVLAIVLCVWLLMAADVPRAVILCWNLIGSALLAVVMSIALLSSPIPIRIYMNDPPLLVALHFPYGYIIPFCVGGALFGHILVFRWLALQRAQRST